MAGTSHPDETANGASHPGEIVKDTSHRAGRDDFLLWGRRGASQLSSSFKTFSLSQIAKRVSPSFIKLISESEGLI